MLKHSINYKATLTGVIIILILSTILYFRLNKKKETFEVTNDGYRYYKWEISKVRTNNYGIQADEFTFYDSSKNRIPINMNSVKNPGGRNPVHPTSDYWDQTPKRLVDNKTNTKWFSYNEPKNNSLNGGVITFDLGTNPIKPMYYSWKTGTDAPERDPVSWKIYGSNVNDMNNTNQSVWVLLDTQNDFPVSIETVRPSIVKLNPNNFFSLNYPRIATPLLLDDTITTATPRIPSQVLLDDTITPSPNQQQSQQQPPTQIQTQTPGPTVQNFTSKDIETVASNILSGIKNNDTTTIRDQTDNITSALDRTQSNFASVQTTIIPSLLRSTSNLGYPNTVIQAENITFENDPNNPRSLLSRTQTEKFEDITPKYTPNIPLGFNPSKTTNLNLSSTNQKQNQNQTQTKRVTRKQNSEFLNNYIPPNIKDFENAEPDWKKEWVSNLKTVNIL